MLFRPILSPIVRLFAVSFVLCVALGSVVHAQNRGDDVLQDMSQAFKKNDRKRLTALLPQAKGHPLEPWAAYWELRARLDEAGSREVSAFLERYAGTYQEDRLRNDWLLLLGQRRDWSTFAAEHPKYRMGDDREVRCYALLVDYLRNPSAASPTLGDDVRKSWLSQRDADDGCALAADRLIDAKLMNPADAWRKARTALDTNRPRAARRAVEIIAPEAMGLLNEAINSPSKFLLAKATTATRKELAVLALVKLAQGDVDAAQRQLQSHGELEVEQRNWVWGVIGKQAAQRLIPEAADLFSHVSRDADLNDDLLIWKVRANLRASTVVGGINSNVQGRWNQIVHSVNAMSDDARRDPTWAYWKARGLLQQGPAKRAEATALLESIASVRGFYEQLALEELGQKVTLPTAPVPLTQAEKDAARQNANLSRGLYAISMGLRAEGVREWNYGTNLVNGQGQPGGMTERELLAAADYACSAQVWDRCINTSERTKTEFDHTQRFPMPFRDAVVQRASQISLDPAYVYGLIRQESRFIMDARSSVGASGLMQVMPATARWTAKKIGLDGFTPDQITNRDTNIAIGTGYLKLVLDDFAGSMPMAAAAYNAGPSRPRAWRNGPAMEAAIWAENVPFSETRDYVKKVLANTTLYAAILSGQPQSLKAKLGHVGPREGALTEVNRDLP
ncbi:MAG: lytic transglycosylase domain-containing protein [Betaproteobacteria bacterium]|nr:lytic transglycosylase domain-containing protein [Betaproteobacteria bacterium]